MPNKNNDTTNCIENIELPIILHFSPESLPPTQKLINDIAESNKKLSEYGITLKFIDMKFDAPVAIKYEEFHFEMGHNRNIIHVYFINTIIPNKRSEGIAGFQKTVHDKSFIVISSLSQPTTLAHEIGHYFSLNHIDEKDNIMNSDRDRENPYLRFHKYQIDKMKKSMERANIVKSKCYE